MNISHSTRILSFTVGLTLAIGCGENASTGMPAEDQQPNTQTGGSAGAEGSEDGGANSGGANATSGSGGASASATCTEPVVFVDVRSQTQEFIDYNSSIALSEDEEEVKRSALEAIPAPCCSDNSAYVCCCPCNMAKTIWGLSNHMVADLDCSAEEVREAVGRWVKFINPGGFSGDSCYTGGCQRAFSDNGCGGMDEDHLVFGEDTP